ncbi:MAG: nucleotidyl transferase AbiEii/AbiGii toxin family protein [Nanoarchaeota archaeon]
MKIPLYLQLKRELHKKIAQAQDVIIEEVYKFFEKPVLHGGTAIWRCYQGKRFSEDLDFYLPKNKEKIERLFQALEKRGLKAVKKKVTENSVYSEWMWERITVRLKATFQSKKRSIADYELVNGNYISIYTLTPEEFIKEKIAAYLKRKKIRDLWDIFFLLPQVKEEKEIRRELKILIENFVPPIDEADLKAIILQGIVPSSREMMEYIKRKWERANI